MATPHPDGAAVLVEGLAKSYGDRRVLDGVTFRVQPGEVFALLGPNGAGKTTTVEILEGYRRPDAGLVRVLGLDPQRDARALRPRTGLMLQEGGLHPGIRVREVLALFASFYPSPRDPGDLLQLAGLAGEGRTPVRRLSPGQRQRLSFALALAGSPDLVFLDEPTSGMDARARRATWDVIRTLAREGTTILVTTHLLDEAERLADRIAIVDRGRVVAQGTPAALVEQRERVEFRTDRPIDVASLSHALSGAAVREVGHNRYALERSATPVLLQRLAIWLAEREVLMLELSSGRKSLEETFLRLTAPEQGP